MRDGTCHRWICLPPSTKTSFLGLCSHVPDPQAWRVDALSLLGGARCLCFPPVAMLGKLVTKILYQWCQRLILIAPGWPNMSWLWDLVDLSVQVPLPTTCSEYVDSAVQPVPTQRFPRAQPSCLAHRASSIQTQEFSDEVATRIEAPQTLNQSCL